MATATKTTTQTETIARLTVARHEPLTIFAGYQVARSCYGSLANYVSLMEAQLNSFSAYQVWYSNEGYAVLKTGKLSN